MPVVEGSRLPCVWFRAGPAEPERQGAPQTLGDSRSAPGWKFSPAERSGGPPCQPPSLQTTAAGKVASAL